MGVQEIEARRRRDTLGVWHEVATAPCEECGCLYDYSIDVPGLAWEAGEAASPSCPDPTCDCHVLPENGVPFLLHFQWHAVPGWVA